MYNYILVPKNEEISINTLTDAKPRKKTRQIEVTLDGEKHNLYLTPVKHNVMASNYKVWIVEPDLESEFSESLNELYPVRNSFSMLLINYYLTAL